jgi:hypothetical protein
VRVWSAGSRGGCGPIGASAGLPSADSPGGPLKDPARCVAYETGGDKPGVLVMSSIPLDLQRRFERRWAARFSRPNPPTAPQRHQLEKQDQQLAAPGNGELRVCPGGVSAGPKSSLAG